jgi:anti-anti-sigma factor
MMNGLFVKEERNEHTILLSLYGVLDISTTNAIEPHLESLDGIDLLIFDFGGLDFIDSTGIGSIINAIHLAREKGFILRFQGINDMTHQVFEMVGLYQILDAMQGEVI